MTLLRISELIECKHITSVLVCLHMRGTMSRTEIYDAVAHIPSMSKKLDFLEEKGLITSSVNGRRTEMTLTERGRVLAEDLCALEMKLYGRVGDPNNYSAGNVYLDGSRRDETVQWYGGPRDIELEEGRVEGPGRGRARDPQAPGGRGTAVGRGRRCPFTRRSGCP